MAAENDISGDVCTHILEEYMGAHTALMTETVANGGGSHSIVRYSGARKFNQEDPIEAAAVEMILNNKAK